jgi:hypothetical protein
MNNTFRTVLITSIVVLIVVALGIGVFVGGVYFGKSQNSNNTAYGYGPYNMMGGYPNSNYSNLPNNYGPGMMDGGMMGGYGSGLASAQPISVDDAKKAVDAYLAQINNPDLELKEIMIFDNGGYAIVKEKSTGVGAFELLIDPVALVAYPEYGPNMMWNLNYGMMNGNANNGGYGMMGGGMMGRWNNNAPNAAVSSEMPVSSQQAAQDAQKYLDDAMPGVKVSEDITPFYGYYTIDLERDGKIIGMLSVNGYSGQVFLHTWHGKFIQMTEYNNNAG